MISALVELLGSFYQSGDFNMAEAIARSLLAAIPEDTVATLFLGLVCYRTGRLPEALRFFSRAERRPDESDVPGGPAAAECLNEATRPGSSLAHGWYELGLVLARHRRYRQAANALAAAVAARPGFVEAQRAMRAISSRLHRSEAGDRPTAAGTTQPRRAPLESSIPGAFYCGEP